MKFGPYPRCWVLTCRLMPTMERKTLPQLGHRHLYITFTEFWGTNRARGTPSWVTTAPGGDVLGVLGFFLVPFSSAEPARRGERGRSRSRSRRQPAGSSGPRWSVWGCPRGVGARGWRCRCPHSSARWWCCCRCPTRRRSPSRDHTLPARLHGGGHEAIVTVGRTKTPPRGLSSPNAGFNREDISLLFISRFYTKPLCFCSVPAPTFTPLPRPRPQPAGGQRWGTHTSHGSQLLFLSPGLHLTPRE